MKLDCKQFSAEIPDFLEDALDDARLSAFLEHLDTCEDCREELTIQYLVYEGLDRVESGETFNVQRDLGAFVEVQRRRLLRREHLAHAAAAAEILTLAAFVVVMSLVLFY